MGTPEYPDPDNHQLPAVFLAADQSLDLTCLSLTDSGMLSPRTGLGFETLWPRPQVVRPRGLVYWSLT